MIPPNSLITRDEFQLATSSSGASKWNLCSRAQTCLSLEVALYGHVERKKDLSRVVEWECPCSGARTQQIPPTDLTAILLREPSGNCETLISRTERIDIMQDDDTLHVRTPQFAPSHREVRLLLWNKRSSRSTSWLRVCNRHLFSLIQLPRPPLDLANRSLRLLASASANTWQSITPLAFLPAHPTDPHFVHR